MIAPVIFAQTDPKVAAREANGHAFEQFQLFRQMTKGNFGFSPFSSHRVAAILAEAARGQTQSQLLAMAHLKTDSDARKSEAGLLSSELASSAGRGGMLLDVATSIWAPPGVVMEPAFESMVKDRFGASLEMLPAADPAASAVAVNKWIRDRTRGRIQQMVGADAFEQGDGAILAVNAIYLKANWSDPFQAKRTRPRPFILTSGSQTLMATMLHSSSHHYGEAATWQCLEMAFGGGDTSMFFLLPRSEKQREQIEAQLTPEAWAKVLAAMASWDVSVMMPRFAFSTQVDMKALWVALGAKDAFEKDAADFSGMTSFRPCWVTRVLHETTIEVNEAGAIASAVTAAPFGPAGPADALPQIRKATFIADHPFVWFIIHRATGLILFMGRFAGE